MVEIETVHPGTPAAKAGLQPGDRIRLLNEQPIRDLLDFHFQLADEDDALLEVVRGAETLQLNLRRNGDRDLGVAFAPIRTRLCGNECVFCFIDQNPAGMRPTLYVKDEDYRLSFLHGNFVTLTNMKEWEIRRIVEQRLSPIYVSVHSTNPETRRRLLRARKERDIMPILDYFRQNGIVMHTQVVLCPGYNDGEDLDGTLRDLAAYYPAVQSLAIVPLGMTDHREGLVQLDPVTPEMAERTMGQVAAFQEAYRKRWGIRFVYLADEWYRLLGRPVPPATHYDGFPQIENGIGMTRQFLNGFSRMRRVFPETFFSSASGASPAGGGSGPAHRPGRKAKKVCLITGALFRGTLEAAMRAKLERTGETVEIEIVGVENRFFGSRVTVAGLLVGRDIADAIGRRREVDLVVLPPATLNEDDLFLDSMSRAQLEEEIGVPVRAGFRNRYW